MRVYLTSAPHETKKRRPVMGTLISDDAYVSFRPCDTKLKAVFLSPYTILLGPAGGEVRGFEQMGNDRYRYRRFGFLIDLPALNARDQTGAPWVKKT